jgi:hypothetical protein
MRSIVISAITLTSLIAGSTAFAAQSTGRVGSYDRTDQTFWVDGEKYQLPASARGHPQNGDLVSVRWDSQGEYRIVDAFVVNQTSADED